MPTVQIERLLDTAIKQGATDIHLTVGKAPTLRVSGRLKCLKTNVLEPDDTIEFMKSITPKHNQLEVQKVGGTDFAHPYGNKARFRVSVFKSRNQIALVLRRIPTELMNFEQIGLPPIVAELCHRPRGLFLVTGPTGSGKTTTLASMVNYINESMDRHIITVEDPIEYQHAHKKSIINQREVGADVPSFSEALRRALRQDPDVLMVGEMRDLETMEAAIQGAETGHLVFATLHTTGAAGTINRIIDAFPVNHQSQIRAQLSTSLMAVLSQQLLTNQNNSQPIACYEFMVVTPAISNLVRENKTYQIDSAIQTGAKFGMQLLDDHLWTLYRQNLISAEQMINIAKDPKLLAQKVHSHGESIGRSELDVGLEGSIDSSI